MIHRGTYDGTIYHLSLIHICKEVAEKIKIARGYGDLSENSEYDEAKNEQGMVEGRIALLEKMLKHARVIDEDDLTNDAVSVGSHVKLRDEDGELEEYDITGSTEADPLSGKISDESPVGAALIGHAVEMCIRDRSLPKTCTFSSLPTATLAI